MRNRQEEQANHAEYERQIELSSTSRSQIFST